MEIYVVQQGDTVSSIATAFDVSVESLIYANQLVAPYSLVIGQALLIFSGEPSGSAAYPLNANGYAYPFINRFVLNETLPYLTRISIFSYGFTVVGDLIQPQLDDQWMIDAALSSGTQPILTLTPFGPDGKFNNQLINQLVNNPTAVQQLITQLENVMTQKGYVGVDIDFEYILASDRDAFTSFVRDMTQRMNSLGYTVSVALAPKTSATQMGLLYEGKDYPALGAVANSVLLMTYEWGYTYGPPMAVAPINKVRQVLEYAVTEIPHEKIDMGIPNYGYDWTLPFEQGITRARTIGNIEAIQLALRKGAEIQFDEVAQSPFFRYVDYGRVDATGTGATSHGELETSTTISSQAIEHEVWFEDVRSIQAKFDLIKEFNLRGTGYWQIMQLFRANWLLLTDNFLIEKEY